jgi:hypothetical protein
MIDPVICRHRPYQERIHAVETCDVVAILIRIGSSLMVRIDTTARAEVVFGSVRIELIQLQYIFTLNYA